MRFVLLIVGLLLVTSCWSVTDRAVSFEESMQTVAELRHNEDRIRLAISSASSETDRATEVERLKTNLEAQVLVLDRAHTQAHGSQLVERVKQLLQELKDKLNKLQIRSVDS